MKLKKLLPVFIFLLCCIFYVLAAFPSVSGGDSGEIITAAFLLGIPHPPGYPVYTLLGKLFTYLPVSNIAFRVNLLALFFGALASVMLYLMTVSALKRMLPSKETVFELPAFLVALVFAFGGIFFEQALNAKGGIYTLNAFLLFAIIFFVLKWSNDTKNIGTLFFASFLLGLGVANHQTIILILPFLLLYLFMTEKAVFTAGNTVKVFLFFLLGAAFYIYLPVRSLANPSLDWGNPENFTNFIAHITRKGYGKLAQNAFSFDLAIQQLLAFTKYLLLQLGPAFALLGLYGFYLIFKSDKKIFWFFLLIFLVLGPVFIFIINPVPTSDDWPFIQIFTLPALAIFLVFSAAGVLKLLDLLWDKKGASLIVPVILFLLVSLRISVVYMENNHSSDRIAAEYSQNVLKTMDKDGILFASDDSIMFPLAYFTLVEKKRPDIKVYDDYGWIFEHIYGDGFAYLPVKEQNQRRNDFFKKAVFESGRPVYFTPGSRVQYSQGVQSISFGLLKIASKNMRAVDAGKAEKLWNSYGKETIYEVRNYRDIYSRHLAASYMLQYGDFLSKKGEVKEGLEQYERSRLAGYDDPWIQNNLCLSYYKAGMNEEAIKCGEQAVTLYVKSSEAANNLALALVRAGRKEEAEKYYQKASALTPGFSVSDYNTALMYFKEGKYSPALQYANKAVSNNPDYYQAYIIIGSVHFGNKKYEDALLAFKKSKELNPSFPEARYNLGAVYLELGRPKEAKEELTAYLSLSPEAPNSAQIKELLKTISK